MKTMFGNVEITTKQAINIILLVILIIFIGQNVENVRVKFLFFGFEIPLIIIIVVAFVLGFFTSTAFSIKRKSRTRPL